MWPLLPIRCLLTNFQHRFLEPFSRKLCYRNRKVFFYRFVDGVLLPFVHLCSRRRARRRRGPVRGVCTTDDLSQCPKNEILCASQCVSESSPVSIFVPLYLENCKSDRKFLNYGALTYHPKAPCKFSKNSMEPFSRTVFHQNRKTFFFRFVDGVLLPFVHLCSRRRVLRRRGSVRGYSRPITLPSVQ